MLHHGLRMQQILMTLEEKKMTTVCEEAESLVGGVRRQEYGPAYKNFARIRDMWNIVLRDALKDDMTCEDVAMMMTCLKIARWAENPDKRDNIVDAIGYLRLIEIMRDETGAEPLK